LARPQWSGKLTADDWKDDIAHDAIRFLQGRAGDFEQQVLLAADTFQIIKQFALNPMLGTCAVRLTWPARGIRASAQPDAELRVGPSHHCASLHLWPQLPSQ
jgi:hypothetical protein